MPRVRTAGPVKFDGQLATMSASDDDNYTEQIIVSVENQPVTHENLVQYQKTSGNDAQAFYSTE